MNICAYFARPIESKGEKYRLVSLLINGNYSWHQETGKKEEITKLAAMKNHQLRKLH